MTAPLSEPPAPRSATMGTGAIVGLIGAAVVALFFLGVDIMRGHPLLTPSILGEVFVLRRPEAVTSSIDMMAVVVFTGAHILAFIIFGLILTALAKRAEQSSLARYAVIQLLVVFLVAFLGLLMVASETTRGFFPVAAVLTANVFAAIAMVWYLWRNSPALRSAWRKGPFEAREPTSE